MPRLVAIDGLSVVRRNWEANPAADSADKIKATISSTLSTLRRTLQQHQPTHQVAVFDHPAPTFRHEMYAGYRASRTPMSPILREGLAEIQAAYLDQLGLVSLTIPGVEADDTLATLAKNWIDKSRGDSPVLVSTDKDLTQTLALGARQWHPFENVWMDEAWVLKKFCCPPALVGDCLALMGDSSDDVPGVRGIGPKTAGPLLVEYGGLEQLLASAEKIPGKLGERLVIGRELALLSRDLVKLKMDVVLGTTWSNLAVPPAFRASAPAKTTATAAAPPTIEPPSKPAASLMELKGF